MIGGRFSSVELFISFGIALNTSKKVICIDGDGSVIMHMGNLTSIGTSICDNMVHIVLNNAAHDSVGGQPTCADVIDLPLIAKACGYASTKSMSKLDEIRNYIEEIKVKSGPHFIEVKIKKGSRNDLGRPTSSPIQNKLALMKALR